MKCPACQAENPSDSRYCSKCGSSLGHGSGTLTFPLSDETGIKEERRFSPGESFGTRYTIIEEVGRGGMGTVYKAEDKELGTTVALKMILPELSSRPQMIEQFKKETLLGRTVTHENVVRIHDLGEVDKIKYISMDFIKGESLLDLIRTSGFLTMSTCLHITRQICLALKAAHDKGIIHQDLKPHNVMIDNSGRVFVMDFGLAKSVSAPREHGAKGLVGTPRYFSPEQARGEDPDQRSDIYSLGVMMYEMVTGGPPFEADSVEGYIHKHISQKPKPPSKVNPGIPLSCEKIILKCLEKKGENRYQNVEELLADLESQKTAARASRILTLIRKHRLIVSSAAGILVFLLGYFLLRPRPPSSFQPRENSVVVMYAVNNSGDKSIDPWLRWGVADLLITQLAQSKFLHVFPEDRLMQILENMGQLEEERHLSRTLDKIAETENIEYFVLPSFTKAGESLRIDIKMQRSGAKEILSTAFVQGKGMEDLLPMVDQLSLNVKAALNLSPTDIAGDYSRRLDQITTASPEALRYYVEGEQFQARGNFEAAIQSLEKAIEKDPDYAIACLLMAECYASLGDHEQYRGNLRRALALVDRVSERDRYIIQANAAYVLEESPLPVIESYKKLIELYPQDDAGYFYLGAIYRDLEEWDLAIEQYEKILTIDSRSLIAFNNLVFIYTSQGRYEKAKDLTQTVRKRFPSESFSFLRPGIILSVIQGRFDQAAAELKRPLSLPPDNPDLIELKGHIFRLGGDLTSARTIYGRLQQKEEADSGLPGFRGRLWLAHLDLQQGKYDQCQKEILENIELAQKSKWIYDELEFRLFSVHSELQRGRFSGVIEALKPVMEICQKISAKNTPKFALLLSGLAYLGMGQIEEAKKAGQELRRLVEVGSCPKHMRYYDLLSGGISMAENNPEEAYRYYKEAISLLPAQREDSDEHAFYYDALAAAYYRNEDFPRAHEVYKTITSLTTGRLRWGDIYARALYRLGKTSQNMGKDGEASLYYEDFLKLWEDADRGKPEVADARAQLAILRKSQ
jgi:serine/threonine protein kinase/tetratricopeptide (TPR) repeat protein